MASLDFLTPAATQYPTVGVQPSGVGACPVAASSSGDSWIDRLFAPKYIDYPVPLLTATPYLAQQQQQAATVLQPAPALAAPVLTPAAPSNAAPAPAGVPAAPSGGALPAPSTPAPSPVTVVIAPWSGSASLPSFPSSDGGSTPAAPAPSTPAPAAPPAAAPIASPILAPAAPAAPAPVFAQSKILRAFVFNPSFEERERTAQEEYLEDELDEEMDDEIASRMVSRDATAVAFVVPDGCDSLDILFGPIEVNPGCGCDDDLDQIVTVGEAKLGANVCGIDGPLTPGDQVIVTVPWRAASWVDMPAGRLRMPVIVHFYKSTDE